VSTPKKIGRPRKIPQSGQGQGKVPISKNNGSNVVKPHRKQPKKGLAVQSKVPQIFDNPSSSSSTSSDQNALDRASSLEGQQDKMSSMSMGESMAIDPFADMPLWPTAAPSGLSPSFPTGLEPSMSLKPGFLSFSSYDWTFDALDSLPPLPTTLDVTVLCANPAGLVSPERAISVPSITVTDALSELSKLNIDLQVRLDAIDGLKPRLDLESIIYRQGPLYINHYTVAEFAVSTAQELFRILSRLLNNPQCHTPSTSSSAAQGSPSREVTSQSNSPSLDTQDESSSDPGSPFPSASQRPLLSPLALTITSILTQLISLYEIFLHHMAQRIQLNADNLRNIIPFSSDLTAQDTCEQAIRFTNVSLDLLHRIEQILGIRGRPEWGGTGLLSTRQIDVLWSELDAGGGVAPGHGFMRPERVRRSLAKVSSVLGQIALGLNKRDQAQE
jgi:hypothetical protein